MRLFRLSPRPEPRPPRQGQADRKSSKALGKFGSIMRLPTMPRYHLNLHNSVGCVPDEEGSEFRDIDAARSSAIESVRSILSDELSRGSLDMRGKIENLRQ